MWSSDGVALAVDVIEGSGKSATLWLSHATGFCGACWDPVIDLLTPIVERFVVWDFRGHGRSSRSPEGVSWWDMAGDVASVLARYRVEGDVSIGVGHSMGGAALVMAEVTAPGTFDGSVLIEPILLGGPVHRSVYPLAEVVRKRRNVFESRDKARANFRRKAPFSGWEQRALDGYLRDGLRPDGDHLVLSCRPEFEAEVYDTAQAHGVFRLLDRYAPPTTVVVGDHSDTYDVDWAGSIVAAMPHAELAVVAGGGHFIPMDKPAVVAREVRRMIDTLALKTPSTRRRG